jgi:hypothetical protein
LQITLASLGNKPKIQEYTRVLALHLAQPMYSLDSIENKREKRDLNIFSGRVDFSFSFNTIKVEMENTKMNKNKVKISAGLNYFLHKKAQEYTTEKKISLTYLVECSLELFFEEQKKIDSIKNFEERFTALAEILLEINSKLDKLENGK